MLGEISYLDIHKNLNGMILDNKYGLQILKLIILFKDHNFSFDTCT